MSSLQERARPYLARLFRGEETQLDVAAQQLIASWLTMTMMTAPWSNPTYGGGWAIPEAHRRELHGTGAPPQTAQVWIAPCSHDDRPPGTVARGIRYRLIGLDHIDVATPAGVVLPYRPGYAGALSIGNLASLIFGHTYDPIRQPQLYYDGLLGLALKQIWPAAETPLDWPRDFALNYTEFDRLISALEPWQ